MPILQKNIAWIDTSQGQQYVCAGELVALQTLTNVLNYLKMEKIDIQKVCTLLMTAIDDANA